MAIAEMQLQADIADGGDSGQLHVWVAGRCLVGYTSLVAFAPGAFTGAAQTGVIKADTVAIGPAQLQPAAELVNDDLIGQARLRCGGFT